MAYRCDASIVGCAFESPTLAGLIEHQNTKHIEYVQPISHEDFPNHKYLTWPQCALSLRLLRQENEECESMLGLCCQVVNYSFGLQENSLIIHVNTQCVPANVPASENPWLIVFHRHFTGIVYKCGVCGAEYKDSAQRSRCHTRHKGRFRCLECPIV